MSSTSAYVALLRTVQALAQHNDANPWPELLTSAVRVVPGAEGGSIQLRHKNHYRVVSLHGYPEELNLLDARIPLEVAEVWYGEGLSWQGGEPRILSGEGLHRTIERCAQLVRDTPKNRMVKAELLTIQTNLCLPIVLGEELLAYINLDNHTNPNAFSPESVVIAQHYVLQVTALLSVQRERLTLETRLREFETIASLSKAFQSSLALDEVVQCLADEITRLINSPHISIFLINEEKNGLENRLALGHFSEILGLFIPKGKGLSWAALDEHHILRIPDLSADPRTFDPRVNQPHKPYTQITAPLFDSAGKPLGVIHISRPLPGRFSEQEVRLMELIGNIAATALERGIAAAHLERQLREFEVIARLSEALRTSTDLHTTAERLGREISHLMDSPHVDILLVNEAQTQLESLISLGLFAPFQNSTVPKGAGLSWSSLNENRILYIPNVHADPRTYNPTPEFSPAHAQLTTPLFDAAGQPLGVIHAARNLPRNFSTSDMRLLAIIGNFAATALERARSAAQLELQLRESQVLLKTLRILATGDQEEVWQELLEAAVELVPGSQGGSLWIRQGNLFVMMAQQGFSDVLLGQSFPENTIMLWSSNGERWGSGQPVIRRRSFLAQSADLSDYYISPEQHELFRDYGRTSELQCTVSIPIKQGDQVIAHIDLDNFSDEAALDERSIAVGRRFALQVGALLAAQRQNAEREAAFEGALRAIGVALEARDLETFGHTDRVATLAIRVGERLGLTPDQLRELRWGAYLHDMGKLMIPDTILLKPAKLTPEEFIVMKTHAYTGYQLSQNLPFLPKSVREVIHHHHERWDGNGYPAGFSGEEIPLMARIFSVCDVFDALTSSRPYKPAWAIRDALEEISKQSGKHFDPQVVVACLEVIAGLEIGKPMAKS